jgi:predicted glutamine amidotransferase
MDTLRRMFINNPHGAGYMTARNGRVEISKGFMTWADFARAVRMEAFTAADPVVYHFRISTQAGVNPEMTHPFPLTSHIEQCKLWDVACPIGVAHNGIIRLTSNSRDREYSDTAHYIVEFLRYLVRDADDLRNAAILDAIHRTTDSRWALMDSTGYIATVGDFIEEGGCLYSNGTFRAAKPQHSTARNYKVCRGFFDDEEYYY